MKAEQEIKEMIEKIANSFNPMNFEYFSGIENALMWVIGDLTDSELLTGEDDES